MKILNYNTTENNMTFSPDINIITKIARVGRFMGQWIPHGNFALTSNPTRIPAKSLGITRLSLR